MSEMVCLEEAARQVHALYPRASSRIIRQDVAELAWAARKEARQKFPTDQKEQRRYVSTAISAAIQRALGSIKSRTTH